jgi:hypothetical protein
MKQITEIVRNYDALIESFEMESLIQVDDDDYQGDSYVLFRNNDQFGILIFGWGSCSGCDALESITDHYPSGKNKVEIVKDLNEFRDEMYSSITWRSRDEMVEYVSTKDFGLEWYNFNDGGRKFVKELKNYSF